jgi:hypothetical protein
MGTVTTHYCTLQNTMKNFEKKIFFFIFNRVNLTARSAQRGGLLPKPNMSKMFASVGEPNAIKKWGIPHNFFSKCAIKRGIHHKCSSVGSALIKVKLRIKLGTQSAI